MSFRNIYDEYTLRPSSRRYSLSKITIRFFFSVRVHKYIVNILFNYNFGKSREEFTIFSQFNVIHYNTICNYLMPQFESKKNRGSNALTRKSVNRAQSSMRRNGGIVKWPFSVDFLPNSFVFTQFRCIFAYVLARVYSQARSDNPIAGAIKVHTRCIDEANINIVLDFSSYGNTQLR